MVALTLALALTAAQPVRPAQPAMHTVCVVTDDAGACVASYRAPVQSRAMQAWVAQQVKLASVLSAPEAAAPRVSAIVDMSQVTQAAPQTYRVRVNGETVHVTILE